MKPLKDAERRLAEVTARLIAKAGEVGLPDAPDKLVTPHALRFLAQAHLELLDQVRALPERADQIALAAIEAALGEVARQQGGIATTQIVNEAKSEGMLAARPFMDSLPRHPNEPIAPRLVRSPDDVAKLAEADLLAIYCRVMRETEDVFVKYESYIVRLWDGMDGCWTDCTDNVGRDAALQYWAAKTDGGAHHVAFNEINYYRIFPGGTHMLWDGSEGREMHR